LLPDFEHAAQFLFGALRALPFDELERFFDSDDLHWGLSARLRSDAWDRTWELAAGEDCVWIRE